MVVLTSCDLLKREEEKTPIASVDDIYLYKEDIEDLLSENISKEDSTALVSNYINTWATETLLVEGAKRNLPIEQLEEFDRLVTQYKNDLYSKAYLEALVGSRVDSVVTDDEAKRYYNNHQDVFRLNEELIMLRYINVSGEREDFKEVKERFVRFDSLDKKVLDSIAIQFKSYSLKDSVWVKANHVVKKIPVINHENKGELLKKSNFIQLEDSLGVYLVRITNVLERNSQAPLEYVKPTIDQIVVNKRKLDYIKQLKQDITKDAVKNKQFKTYP